MKHDNNQTLTIKIMNSTEIQQRNVTIESNNTNDNSNSDNSVCMGIETNIGSMWFELDNGNEIKSEQLSKLKEYRLQNRHTKYSQ